MDKCELEFVGVGYAELIEVDEFKAVVRDQRSGDITDFYYIECCYDKMGYVAIDVFESIGVLSICQLYILPQNRCNGVGSWVVSELIMKAQRLGFDFLSVRPHPIDNMITLESLVGWYCKMGFEKAFAERREIHGEYHLYL
jgi:GNAT superfamily N-acetyltransferase